VVDGLALPCEVLLNAAGDLRCDVNLRGFEMAYLRGAAHHQGVRHQAD